MVGATQTEVRRGKSETSVALIRRFSRRAKSTNIVRMMRKHRYYARAKSKNVGRKRALVGITRRNAYNMLVRLGKIDPTVRRGRRK